MISTLSLQSFFIDFLGERGIDSSLDEIESFNFMASGLLDSFELLTMFIQLEMSFGIKLTPEEISDEANADVCGLVKTLLAKAQ
ncbi:hypothetical protein [Thalassotalea euphylliae]|uniref:Acyl carrier protein n=1 Tax=Thalassotalea euphylliae TaxID=1655234 RepID=A0A3E0UE40_9GAMM|nr:hypothetical protein [Thalassotalea euphylliae]REL34843.1 hypothetical protein DXX92_05410 [Thalassotalea euphylliae]